MISWFWLAMALGNATAAGLSLSTGLYLLMACNIVCALWAGAKALEERGCQ
jgi:hypothetical protein